MIQSQIWIRWYFNRKWREATRRRVLRDRELAATAGKPFRMTAVRRFVLGRL